MNAMASLLDDICLSSIHKLEGTRTLICVGIWSESGSVTQVDFYEPATDKVNESTVAEVEAMIRLKQLVLHSPGKGRTLKPKKWQH